MLKRKAVLRDEIAGLETRRADLADQVAELKREAKRHGNLMREAVRLKAQVAHLKEELYILGNVTVTKARILRAFVEGTGFSASDVRSKRRTPARLILVRQAVCYWMVRRTKSSLPEIGRFLGYCDHTTVRHSAQVYPAKRSAMGRRLSPVDTGKR